MFQFRRFPSYTYFIQYMIAEVFSAGLLHSDISGSKRTYRSPELFAVNHVLLRLPMPRHSPCALFCFTICFLLWVLVVTFVVLLPDKIFYSIVFILVVSSFALLFALFSFQVSFLCSWEQISVINFFDYSYLCSESHFYGHKKNDLLSIAQFLSPTNLFLLITFLFSVKRKVSGGHKWTRTIDLTLIRRAL